ncbi:hypothetical protein ACU6U9_22660 [Pseudomonas sp. HK3]
MNIPIWHYALSMAGYIAFLLLLIDIMRKHPRIAFALWMAALLSFPLWDQVEGWFRWSKIISVLVPTAIIVGGARIAWYYRGNTHPLMRTFRGSWVLYVLYGVLFLNIAEATLKDLTTGNYFNAICGMILCATIPLPLYKNKIQQYWVISKDRPNELLFYSTASWNFLYTTWNMCFVYGESPAFFASSFCILMAAELYPVLKKRPELYMIARVYSLALHVLVRGIHDVFTPVMNSEPWFNENTLMIWGGINLALHIPFAIWYLRKQHKTKTPPYGVNPPPHRADCVNEFDQKNEQI